MFRILVTGSREWRDQGVIEEALLWAAQGRRDVTVVHGWAEGADTIADRVTRAYGWIPEGHPADMHTSPKHRNDHMVRLGADICLSFAESWASGTGHCARAARRAGIPVVDYGVDTRIESRPW